MTDRWKYFLEFQNQRQELKPQRQVVGRSRKCDLSIPDPSASRKHVVLTPGEGLIALEDLGSSNGTFINGEQIQGTGILRHDDQLSLGDAEVKVVIEASVPLETVRLPTDDLAVPGAEVGEATTMLQAASVRLAQDAIGQPPVAAAPALDPQPPATTGSHMAPPPIGSGQHMTPPAPGAGAPAAPIPSDPLRTAHLDPASFAGAIPSPAAPAGSAPDSTPPPAVNPLATTILPANPTGTDPLLTARLDAHALRAQEEAAVDPRQTTRIDTSQFQNPAGPPEAVPPEVVPPEVVPHPSSPEAEALQTSRLSPEQLRAVQDQLTASSQVVTPPLAQPSAPEPLPELAIPDVPSLDPEPLSAFEASTPAEAFQPPALDTPPLIELPPLEAPVVPEPAVALDPPAFEVPDIELPPELQLELRPEPVASTEPSFSESAEVPSFDLPTMDLPAFEAPDSFPAAPAFEAPLPGGQELPTFEAPDFASTPASLPALDLDPPAINDLPPLDPDPPASPALAFEAPSMPPAGLEPPAPPATPSFTAEPAAKDSFGEGAYVPPPAHPPLEVPVPSSAVPDLRDLAAQRPPGGGDNEMLSSLEGFDTTLGPGAELPPSMQRAQESLARTRDETEVEATPAAANPYVSPDASQPPAGFFIRVAAALIDFLWMGGLSAAAAAVPLFLSDLVPVEVGGLPVAALLGTGVAVFNLLVVLVGWSVWGRTPGKKITGLAVCDAQGKPGIGFPKALVRLFGYFISSMFFGLGHLLALGKNRKALHDYLAGTIVRKL